MRPAMLALLLTVACATGASHGTVDGSDQNRASRSGSRDRISSTELASSQANNVYDVIAQLRPSFLQPHRSASMSGRRVHAVVYIDGTPLGDGFRVLRQMRPEDVAEIRFLSGPDATQRFGTGHPGGAILVKTKH